MQRGSTSPLSRETDAPETIVKLECDIDDASPEVLAYAADRLREAGAREVHWLPVYCKKGRPGWQLQVICTYGISSACRRLSFWKPRPTAFVARSWNASACHAALSR